MKMYFKCKKLDWRPLALSKYITKEEKNSKK